MWPAKPMTLGASQLTRSICNGKTFILGLLWLGRSCVPNCDALLFTFTSTANFSVFPSHRCRPNHAASSWRKMDILANHSSFVMRDAAQTATQEGNNWSLCKTCGFKIRITIALLPRISDLLNLFLRKVVVCSVCVYEMLQTPKYVCSPCILQNPPPPSFWIPVVGWSQNMRSVSCDSFGSGRDL